ncbi:hypothetical protein L6452_15856 [Arctium lappa]|uniref:Uncharacterized protein n=1 Tax=Arctium lappa TaxID=4217 RepID=A0ACB9CQG3_ARCLA|nr:hypothetical protein L6452_15856 [Arctium lappa]
MGLIRMQVIMKARLIRDTNDRENLIFNVIKVVDGVAKFLRVALETKLKDVLGVDTRFWEEVGGVVPLQNMRVDEKLYFIEEPEAIVDRVNQSEDRIRVSVEFSSSGNRVASGSSKGKEKL